MPKKDWEPCCVNSQSQIDINDTSTKKHREQICLKPVKASVGRSEVFLNNQSKVYHSALQGSIFLWPFQLVSLINKICVQLTAAVINLRKMAIFLLNLTIMQFDQFCWFFPYRFSGKNGRNAVTDFPYCSRTWDNHWKPVQICQCLKVPTYFYSQNFKLLQQFF